MKLKDRALFSPTRLNFYVYECMSDYSITHNRLMIIIRIHIMHITVIVRITDFASQLSSELDQLRSSVCRYLFENNGKL